MVSESSVIRGSKFSYQLFGCQLGFRLGREVIWRHDAQHRRATDPPNPRAIGFFIALAMTAQPRQPLATMKPMFGSGVYALYYDGPFPQYAPIRSTETPIYVGQAAPGNENARTPVEQGIRLAARLNEHRKTIERATSSLDIKNFECRALVVQTGWETAAEDYLIRLFRPIWNKETKIIQGFGKHGDAPTTRKNKVSSWDVLHQGACGRWTRCESRTKISGSVDAAAHRPFRQIPRVQESQRSTRRVYWSAAPNVICRREARRGLFKNRSADVAAALVLQRAARLIEFLMGTQLKELPVATLFSLLGKINWPRGTYYSL
jgi:Eco29kI restriction endonuclease